MVRHAREELVHMQYSHSIRKTGGAMLVAVIMAAAASLIAQTTQDKPASPVNVTGKWQTTLEMEVGNATVTLEFAQDVEKLGGSYTGRYGKYPLAGTIKARVLEFVVTINAEGTETQMSFVGELDAAGAVIKGSANLGGMGDAGWIAKKGT